jgi:hypothetical protein
MSFDIRKSNFLGENSTMTKLVILLATISVLLALSACGATNNSVAGNAVAGDRQNQEADGSESVAEDSDITRLTEESTDALSTEAQLALGTLQLEQTELAVNKQLASELLPLWRTLQSLHNSDTAAELEVNTVINQIQDKMDVGQISAIADMKLTEESMTAMIESGEIAFRRGGDTGSFAGGRSGGGGLLGGGPGSVREIPPGGDRGNLSEDDIATRQPQVAEGGFGRFQDRMLTSAVIRLLQTKTGESPERVTLYDTVLAIVSEGTGLSMEDVQDQMGEGITLTEIVENNGGDLDTIKASLVEAFQVLPNRADSDIDQLVDEWLNR